MLVNNVNSNASCRINSKAINCVMGKKKKIELEDWQAEDVRRLRALFEEKAKKSQAAFGEDSGIGTQGMVWQYLNGVTPLNYDAVMKFSDGLGVKASEISPVLWGKIERFFYSQTQDERVLLTDEQKRILQLAARMTEKIKENWIANGELLTSVTPAQETLDAPGAERDLDRRKRPDKGPRARERGYGMGETIRSGDLLPDDYFTEKRKKDGNAI